MAETALQDSAVNKQSAAWCGALAAKLGVGQAAGSSEPQQPGNEPGQAAPDRREKDISCSKDIAAMTAAEIEDELKKKNALLATLTLYASKGPFTKEDCNYIRNTYGCDPVCMIPLAPNNIPAGTPIAATYCDEISEEEKAQAQCIIAKHFPQAKIRMLKEKGTNRDVWAIVGLDAKLASGVLIMEQERIAVMEQKKALEEELPKREAGKTETANCFAEKIQKEKIAGVKGPPARFTERVTASEENALPGRHVPQ